MQAGVMKTGIIGQYKDPAAGVGAYLTKLFHEGPKRFRVKSAQLPLIGELSISKAYGTKVANTFARWVVQDHRVFAFGRNPHSAPGTMLLKMHFIQGPNIGIAGARKLSDFF
jgi:hypothetical protein